MQRDPFRIAAMCAAIAGEYERQSESEDGPTDEIAALNDFASWLLDVNVSHDAVTDYFGE